MLKSPEESDTPASSAAASPAATPADSPGSSPRELSAEWKAMKDFVDQVVQSQETMMKQLEEKEMKANKRK